MLSEIKLKTLIAQGEGQTIEFKEAFTADPIRKSLVSFSNDFQEQGVGFILVGVKDDGIINGVRDPDSMMLKITDLCRDSNTTPSILPNIYTVEVDGKSIVVAEVKQSQRRPHRAANICYVRIGSSNRVATTDEEFEIIRKTGAIPYDLLPIRNARIDDLDAYKFESEFLPFRVAPEILAMNGRTIPEWMLHIRYVYKENTTFVPTVAAILLFGKIPHNFIPHATIDFIRFEGDDASYPIVDRKTLTGTLDQLIKAGTALIERSMIQGYQFSNKSPVRTTIVEYPLRAIREAVANAIVHRDYEATNSSVSIKMFDDRVEIMSPGGLYGIVTKENFGTGINDYRNPTLATSLNILGLVEKAGTGILQIKRQMRENGSLSPSFEIGEKHLITKLPAHPYYQGVRAYQKGLNALELSNHSEAFTHLTNATSLFPDFAEAWAVLGRFEGIHGDNNKSRIAFHTSIEKNPYLEKTYYDWAKMEESNNEIDASATIYRQGTIAIPDSWLLLYSFAQLKQKQKDYNNALSLSRKAIALNSENPKIYRQLADAAYLCKRWDEAITSYKKAIILVTNDAEKGAIWFSIMKTMIDAKKYDFIQIKECFDAAITLQFYAQELFVRYYRYVTEHNHHAEALQVQQLALLAQIPILTAYSIDVRVSGFAPELRMKEIGIALEKQLQSANLSFDKVNAFLNKNRKTHAVIKVSSQDDAAKIIRFLNSTTFVKGEKLNAQI